MTYGDRRSLVFMRGRHMFRIAPVYNDAEHGFIGIRDGRIVVRGADKSGVAKALILDFQGFKEQSHPAP